MKNIITIAILALLLPVITLGQEVEMFRPQDANRADRQIAFMLPLIDEELMIGVEIVAGKAILEGDIILGEAGLIGAPVKMLAGNRDKRWPNGVIPYVLSKDHPDYEIIVSGIAMVNSRSNLTLIERTNEIDYVEFESDKSCSSWIGRKGGRQEIYIQNCPSGAGSVAHEILHAAGFYHEQSRSDRDDHVTIKWENIIVGQEKAFQTYIERRATGVDIGRYDYGSIMHYHAKGFSKNGQPTILPKVSNVEIGQRRDLSPNDVASIAALYPDKQPLPSAAEASRMRRPDSIVAPANPSSRVEIKPLPGSATTRPGPAQETNRRRMP